MKFWSSSPWVPKSGHLLPQRHLCDSLPLSLLCNCHSSVCPVYLLSSPCPISTHSLSPLPPPLSPFLLSSLKPASPAPDLFPTKSFAYQIARGGKNTGSSATARELSSEALSWLQSPSGSLRNLHSTEVAEEKQRRACPHWLLAPSRCISLKGRE